MLAPVQDLTQTDMSTNSTLVMIVEDEPAVAGLLQDYLEDAGYRTRTVLHGLQVIDAVKDAGPALILLDVMLPGKNGMDLCREIREFSRVPIIMVTARIEEIDRLLGLELGADDYICKPFSPREVVARVRAVLRRTENATSPDEAGLTLDESRILAQWQGSDLNLTAVEFHLLSILASEPGRIFSRSQLMNRIYPDHRIVSDRTIDSHIKKLRKKIDTVAAGQELIRSVYGVGYKFEISN